MEKLESRERRRKGGRGTRGRQTGSQLEAGEIRWWRGREGWSCGNEVGGREWRDDDDSDGGIDWMEMEVEMEVEREVVQELIRWTRPRHAQCHSHPSPHSLSR